MTDTPERIEMGNPLTGEVIQYVRADLLEAANARIAALETERASLKVSLADSNGAIASARAEALEEAAKVAEVDDWKARAEFAEAQLDAVLEQLPPPEAGLLKKRLAERAARPRTPAPEPDRRMTDE